VRLSGATCLTTAAPPPPETVAAPPKRPFLARRGRTVRWWHLVPPALSAVLLAAACPPYDISWLAWIAPAPLFWSLLLTRDPQRPTPNARRLKAPFLIGFTSGFLYLLLLAPWFGAFSPAGYPAAAVYWGLLAGATYSLAALAMARTPVGAAPPVLAAAWTVLEWLRTQGTLTFPWGSLAVTQYRNLPVLQMLDLCGAFGLSFLMALVAAGLASSRLPDYRRPGRRWTAVALGVLLLATLRGFWLLASPPPASPTARVAVVQASESLKAPGAAVVCVSPEGDYDERTRYAVQKGADLIVWPESASTLDAVHDPGARLRVTGLVAGSRSTLLAGSFIQDEETRRTTNGAAMVLPDGRITGTYAKVLIVPFGEYLPARPLLSWTERLGMPSEDLEAGRKWEPLPWDRGKVGVSICYESAFGRVSREMVARGANLLAVLTSDGWAGRRSAGLQHLAFAPLRAVEERRSVARAAATGVSELIDPYGRVKGSLPMFTKGVALAEVPLRDDRTVYSYLGDWPVGMSWLILLFSVLPRRAARA